MQKDTIFEMMKKIAEIKNADPMKSIPADYVACLHPSMMEAIVQYIIDHDIYPAINMQPYYDNMVASFLRRKLFVSSRVAAGTIEYLPYSYAYLLYNESPIRHVSFWSKVKNYFRSLHRWFKQVDFTDDRWRDVSEYAWDNRYSERTDFAPIPHSFSALRDDNLRSISTALAVPPRLWAGENSSHNAARDVAYRFFHNGDKVKVTTPSNFVP